MFGSGARENTKKKLKDSDVDVSYFDIFQYGTVLERAATCLGVLLAFLSGGAIAVSMSALGEMTTSLMERTHPPADRASTHLPIISTCGGGRRLLLHFLDGYNGGLLKILPELSGAIFCSVNISPFLFFCYNVTHEEHMEALLEDIVAVCKCDAATVATCLLLIMLGVALVNWSALRQITTIRLLFLKAVLHQDMSWFDTDNKFNLASVMSENITKVREGMGEKLALISNLLGSAFLSICIVFPIGWELSLACTAVIPFSLAAAFIVSNYQTKSAIREMESYSQAGKHAEEILKSVKTVAAFGGESIEVNRYSSLLQPAEQYGRKRGIFDGLGSAFNWVLFYGVATVAVSYGARLILRDIYKPAEEQQYVFGTVYSILINLFTATQVLSMCIPYAESFGAARGAAGSIFQIINRIPAVDSCSKEGLYPRSVFGEITLEKVHFSYPSRPKIKILNNLSIHIKPGECVAFVGSSGCGKTTLLQLLQRLYEPSSGSVKLDGQDLRNLNLNWLRRSLGVVGQEPVLFRGTVFENIAIGCPQATLDEVHRVAEMANAHDFIQNLPKGYDTVIGERGASLSGGQKQRVAIARSLLRDPAVLLLDEPTSALDPHAELQVQAALDRASAGRTTVVVSHRLSTIVNADRIICMDKGAIVEQGTHEELMAKKGFYHKLQTICEHSKRKINMPEEIAPSLEEAHEELASTAAELIMNRRISVSSRMSVRSGARGVALSAASDEEHDDEDAGEVSGWQILKLNSPEWVYLTVGSIAAFTHGSCLSVLGVFFGYISAIFVLEDHAQILYLADIYAGLFLVIAGLAGGCMWLQSFTFTMAGLKMTSRLRIQYFTALLRQEIGFYDKQSNTVGALCSRLSGDTAAVQSATGHKIGLTLQGISSVLVAVGIGLFFDWRLTLAVAALLPLMLGTTWLENRVARKSQNDERKAIEAAISVATEAIISVKTVQSLGIENCFLDKVTKSLREARSAIGALSYWRGLVIGIGLHLPQACCCFCFYYGTTLVADGSLDYSVIILVTESVVFGAYMLGQALTYSSSFNKINSSTARILSVINRQPLVETHTDALEDKDWPATGNFSLDDVKFTYPTRKKEVLRGIDLNVEAGQTVALVGPSGCGKSTILQLMQRFYDPDSGTITMDGRDVRCALSVARLRGALGVVQQEPALFDRSLADNVAYGDNRRRVPMSEIVAACQTANIHAFIASLPNGYATRLGAGGAQLSGGQKQRVCIARALVRAPRLLLLDEATSALDGASERVVCEALHRAAEGRTCVTIAHRLSTIQHADVIFVLREGKIVERGNHEELMKIQGLYYRMHEEQNVS